MVRIKLAIVLVGIFLVVHGYQEYTLASRATELPVKLDVAAAEGGSRVENPHVTLGDHVRLYGDAIYHFSRKKGDSSGPGPQTRVTKVYYPVVSPSHPYFQELARLEAKHGGTIPPGTKRPAIRSFAVMVKTGGFGQVGDIPQRAQLSPGLTGLAINLVESLPEADRRMVRESFSEVDFDKLIIVEEGRKPGTVAGSTGIAGAGFLLALLGIAWLTRS